MTETSTMDKQVQNRIDEIERQLELLRAELAHKKSAYVSKAKGGKLRRHWTREQKLRILDEAARARRYWGGVNAVLAKYKIHTAHLTQWRKQLGLTPSRNDDQEAAE